MTVRRARLGALPPGAGSPWRTLGAERRQAIAPAIPGTVLPAPSSRAPSRRKARGLFGPLVPQGPALRHRAGLPGGRPGPSLARQAARARLAAGAVPGPLHGGRRADGVGGGCRPLCPPLRAGSAAVPGRRPAGLAALRTPLPAQEARLALEAVEGRPRGGGGAGRGRAGGANSRHRGGTGGFFVARRRGARQNGAIVAEHPRCWGKGQVIFEPLHHLALLERKPGALDHARPEAGSGHRASPRPYWWGADRKGVARLPRWRPTQPLYAPPTVRLGCPARLLLLDRTMRPDHSPESANQESTNQSARGWERLEPSELRTRPWRLKN
jgi:hypothetical protein